MAGCRSIEYLVNIAGWRPWLKHNFDNDLQVYPMQSVHQSHAYNYGAAMALANTGWMNGMINSVDGQQYELA